MVDLKPVFTELKLIMEPFGALLDIKKNGPDELYVDTRHIQKNRKPLFFGAVQVKKSYVSYHLMPVYVRPELLESASEELKGRMQGKSCFNFSSIEPRLFKELAVLTRGGFRKLQGARIRLVGIPGAFASRPRACRGPDKARQSM